MIYLDNSATTKPCQAAVDAMTEALTDGWGNPSALYNFGISAADKLRDARNKVASAMGAEPNRVFFTSGGTEADNWAIFGSIRKLGRRGKHIITTSIEHPAVLNCAKKLQEAADQIHRETKKNTVCLTPLQAEKIIRKFYGLPDSEDIPQLAPAPEPSGIIDLEDLL